MLSLVLVIGVLFIGVLLCQNTTATTYLQIGKLNSTDKRGFYVTRRYATSEL